MNRFLALLLFLLAADLSSPGNPGKKMYPVDAIPEELKEDAVAVIREHQEVFEIESINRATGRIKYVVTILSENGDEYANFHEWYDKFHTLADIKIIIYDKEGGVIERVGPSDIMDYSSFTSYSIYEQNRQKIYSPNINSYPFTISIEYSQTYKGLFVYPTWRLYPGYEISIQKSSFRVIAPKDHKFRYKASNLDIEPEINESSRNTEYYWEVNNLGALESEDYSPAFYKSTGVLYTAPCDFSIDGYKGNMETWDGLGEWAYSLIEGRSEISDATRKEVQKLTEESSDKRDIVRRIYKYMQAKTRYVSIQEGIGGWQPFPALQVDEDGYGDCKALSNYTMALLNEAGIESFYTKVRAGRGAPDIETDFVSNQSNHIILCVPMENDTIWLECTSQLSPFGYIGNFTDDRHVLLVTPEGGKLVKTRVYTAEENLTSHTAELSLIQGGTSDVRIKSIYRGLDFGDVSPLLRKSSDDREKWVNNNIFIENAKVEQISIEQDPEQEVVPAINMLVDLKVNNYGSTTGDRWFIPLNLLTRVSSGSIPERNRNRRTDIVYKRAFTQIDSIYYTLPKGYIVESAPAAKDLKNDFGSYSVSVHIDSNRILYVRKRTMKKGKYPVSMYNEFRQFYIDMQKMDNSKLVLIKAG